MAKHKRHWLAVAAIATALTVSVAACSSSSKKDATGSSSPAAASGSSAGSGSATSSASTDAGLATLAQLYAGTATAPPTTGPKAAKNKTVYYIDCGEQAQACNNFANAGKAAAKALGWNFHVVDANLNTANGNEKALETAIAAKPDAIVQYAESCQTTEPGLEQAKAAHIPVIGVETLDCSDTGGPKLFTVPMIYSTSITTAAQWWTSFGKQAADYIIAASGGTAKVMANVGQGDPQFTFMTNEFLSEMAKCSGCQVVDKVDFQVANEPAWTALFRAALVQHPETTWVWVPFDTLSVELGGAKALTESGVKAKLVSGIGQASALDLIRSGQMTADGWARDATWVNYAAFDELNRYFQGQPAVPEGLGEVSVDANHNMPSSSTADYTSPVDYVADYTKIWTGQ